MEFVIALLIVSVLVNIKQEVDKRKLVKKCEELENARDIYRNKWRNLSFSTEIVKADGKATNYDLTDKRKLASVIGEKLLERGLIEFELIRDLALEKSDKEGWYRRVATIRVAVGSKSPAKE